MSVQTKDLRKSSLAENFDLSIFKIFILVGILITFWGCSRIETKISDDFHFKNNPVRVAILPFDISKKNADEREVAVLFRKTFYNYFSYLGYIDKDIKEIDEALAKNKLTSTKEIYLLSSEKLGRLLGVDALIYCKIIKISNFTAGVYAETSIHAKLIMVDSQSSSVLWEADSKDIDRAGFFQSGTLVSLIQKQIKNSKKEEALARVAGEISRKIVKTIPDPFPLITEDINLPKIHSLNATISRKQTNGGFLLEVFLTGEKGMKASFDIGDWKTGIPMQEKKTGDYAGSYLVKSIDRIKNALIMGKLENSYGLTIKKIYEKGMARFDPATYSNNF